MGFITGGENFSKFFPPVINSSVNWKEKLKNFSFQFTKSLTVPKY